MGPIQTTNVYGQAIEIEYLDVVAVLQDPKFKLLGMEDVMGCLLALSEAHLCQTSDPITPDSIRNLFIP